MFLFVLAAGVALGMLVGCAQPNQDNGAFILASDPRHPDWKPQFRQGERAAWEDIKRGTLGWDGNEGLDEEGSCKLWCFRKILREKYGVQYRLRGHRPIESFAARIEGYQSVMDPYLKAKYGEDWSERAWKEAEALYRDHWPELERQCAIDFGGRSDYFDTHPPITDEERLSADLVDKYYAYQDEGRP